MENECSKAQVAFNRIIADIDKSYPSWVSLSEDDDLNICEVLEMGIVKDILRFTYDFGFEIEGFDMRAFGRHLNAKEVDEDYEDAEDFDWYSWYSEDCVTLNLMGQRLLPTPVQYLFDYFHNTFWPDEETAHLFETDAYLRNVHKEFEEFQTEI